jgi:hypothetical protein
VPSCTLDAQGFDHQRERYRLLALSVTRLVREQDRLVVVFDRDVDCNTLADLIAVETDCCPFFTFTFTFEVRSRRVEVGVDKRSAAAALDAITARFSRDQSP